MKRLPALLPRLAGRRASFKIGVVATLAIAVAANVAVLSNLGVMFGRVVPGGAHQHLVEPYIKALGLKAVPPSEVGIFRPAYDQLQKDIGNRGQVALYKFTGGKLQLGNSAPVRFPYLAVTPSLAAVLGIQVSAGRALTRADMKPGATPVVLVSAQFAKAHFGSVDAAVGKTLKLGGTVRRIVGVLPAALRFPGGRITHTYSFEAWAPFPPEPAGPASDMNFDTYALVHPGPGLSDQALHTALVQAYHDALPHYTADARRRMRMAELTPEVASLARREYGDLITRLQLLELAAVLLFLLVLANLGGLTTADALAQRHEMATRAALGAGARRLYLQRLRELAGLGLVGWAIGIGLGWVGSHALAATVGRAGTIAAWSLPVLGISLTVVLLVAALLSGVGLRRLLRPSALPADLMSGGHATGGRGLVRTLRALIVIQLAASAVLLAIAGHLHGNVFSLMHDKLGFDPDSRTFVSISLPGSYGHQTEAQYEAYVHKIRVFDKDLLRELNGLPGIADAAVLSAAPFAGASSTTNSSLQPWGKGPQHVLNIQTVSKRIVAALGLHMQAGNITRLFDGTGHSVMIDATAAGHFWPGSTPGEDIGRHFYLDGTDVRVVAVVSPLRMKAYGSVGDTAFSPLASSRHLSGGPPELVVHGTVPGSALRKQIADAIKEINPQARMERFQPATALIASAYAGRARMGRVFGALAVVAVLIAAVGLFALLAYRSLVRRPEFAIRGALGATPGRLVGHVISEAFALWAVGCVIGVPAAYALSMFLDSRLPKLGLPAAWVAAAVVLGLGVTSLMAAAGPAHRAARANPITHLQT